ncbi:MAG: hypothetical protein EZS28_048849 [Streblomastix strix]|uniref:Uncharacterized protein n=1 Tax=Streblomastix strix TaxID=222440 RepID=A0A5J4TDT1_9EUKA|nr:MAG: hypothetical protein EZS28_048849 [Streblomastix strix]
MIKDKYKDKDKSAIDNSDQQLLNEEDKKIKKLRSAEYIKKEEDYKTWVEGLGLKESYRLAFLSPATTLSSQFDRCIAWMLVAIRFNDLSLFKRNISKVDDILELATGGQNIGLII